ncbi:PA0069 family radical SAM protein [Noviherbaspirillum saxi]|uniref:PA0069 family radical SAM protein n=1 Tax=Noviherbaspirillum saxi TaxID=2320863 RepID=A0A3A3FQX2_9BURK|nr:PA0069 family radical SAM protein [Noviherbaspirillum saxi]RJF96139.1 PA0069 family radical SAM protein [Noviherbaspirillum saxi]
MANSEKLKQSGIATKGRGACSNPQNRFDSLKREAVEPEPYNGVTDDDESSPKTTVQLQTARRIISINQSPDIPFAASINPYQGCEHGCIYCYARPSHAYLGLSPGLDFETRLFAKENAAEILEAELLARNYVPQNIVIGGNTDPYQPIERKLNITRALLEVLERYNHPVSITTKSALVTRDIDILERMASKGLARVYVSVTSLRNEVSRTLEPRASAPAKRLAAIKLLAGAGIPVGVLVAPVIPAITDEELESILSAASGAGASAAAYILLRLPREVAALFAEWLTAHYPLRKSKVEKLLSHMRGGKLYDPAFETRMTGTGVFADLLANRFHLICKKLALNLERPPLRTDLFVPAALEKQLSLF